MSPILYIARYVLSRKIEKSMKVREILQEIGTETKILSIDFSSSRDCKGSHIESQIVLGTEYLLGVWTLCFDYNTPMQQIHAWQFGDIEGEYKSEQLYRWSVYTLNEEEGPFQQEIPSLCNSVASCDLKRAFRNFEEALWFTFLHELGHVKLNHQKVKQIEEEKEADNFAIDIIKEDMTNKAYESRIKKEGVLLSLICILFHEEVRDWNIDHPSPIQRICDALVQLGCEETDVLWKIAFRFIVYWHRNKQEFFDSTILPKENSMNYKECVLYVCDSVNPKEKN